MKKPRRFRLAVWKFASCDGCQLSLLDGLEELLEASEVIEISVFHEVSSAVGRGPWDLSVVEGSITTAKDAERIRKIRRRSEKMVTIGACATAGGIQALRNFRDVREFVAAVYAKPEYIDTLATSTPIAAHVTVDFELRGCPVDARQVLEVVNAFRNGRRPAVAAHSVCVECKRRGLPCVVVSHGTPCLGPVTQAGCGALCPAVSRGCYGCFGPAETANVPSLTDFWKRLGAEPGEIRRVFHTFNAWHEPFRGAGGDGDG